MYFYGTRIAMYVQMFCWTFHRVGSLCVSAKTVPPNPPQLQTETEVHACKNISGDKCTQIAENCIWQEYKIINSFS